MISLLLLSILQDSVFVEDPVAAGQDLFNRVERDLGKALGKFESHETLPEKSPWWDVIGVKETKEPTVADPICELGCEHNL